MRVDSREVLDTRAGMGHQVVHHGQVDLRHDRQLVLEQQVVVATNGAGNCVLDRHNPVRRLVALDRGKHLFEASARHRLGRRLEAQPGCFTVGARRTLIRNTHESCSPPKAYVISPARPTPGARPAARTRSLPDAPR